MKNGIRLSGFLGTRRSFFGNFGRSRSRFDRRVVVVVTRLQEGLRGCDSGGFLGLDDRRNTGSVVGGDGGGGGSKDDGRVHDVDCIG